ncbi:MAG: HPr family phosphocarrier protein, partial [Actinobacteria bacterium]|nr:HPr family phosphocarrier protein [Actinomycetota bacterium]
SAHGLHARPAALFVQAVNDSGLTVTIEKDGREAPAGSILGVISLAINQGDTVTVTAEGAHADDVLERLVSFLETDHDAQ